MLNVSLVEEAIGLNEVVAIGYGYVKKKDLTGAVSTVSADDMVLGGTVSNAAQALQGKTAGVQVSQSSKAPVVLLRYVSVAITQSRLLTNHFM